MLVQPKQISKIVAGHVHVDNLAFPAASTMNVSAALALASATAGSGGASVPFQVGSVSATGGVEGYIVNGKNLCQVYDSTGQKFAGSSGNEVYGRLTVASGLYTLSLFSLVDGVETPFTMTSPTPISFAANYLYSFDKLPADFATSLVESYQGNDPKALAPLSADKVAQNLPIAAMNAIPTLTYNYTPGEEFFLFVNGEAYSNLGATPALTVVDKVITWLPANAGINIMPSDEVVAFYGTKDLTSNTALIEVVVPVTATNTLGPLPGAYAGGTFFLFVNGLAISNLLASPNYSVSGTAVTWIAANAGYNLSPSDQVIAYYAI